MKKDNTNKVFLGIFLLGLASLFNDIGSEMLTPIMPLFLKALGGGGIVIGLVGGLRDGISSIIKVFSGYVSDRVGKRKVFVNLGYVISFVFRFLLAFSKTANQALFFSSFERIGKLRDAPRDVMISIYTKKRKGKGFGLHQALDTTGGILGGIILLVLFWKFNLSFRFIIVIASIFSFLSLLPLIFVKEIKTRAVKRKLIKNIDKIPQKLLFLFLIIGIFSLANFSYMFFILKASDFFNEKHASIPIMLFVLFNIFYASFAYPFGVLADKFGKKKIILIGYILFSLVSFGFIFSNSLIIFIFLFIFYGLSYSLIEGNQRALVAELSPKEIKGSSIGLFHTIKGFLALPASLIAGFLWNFTHNGVFFYGFITSLIAVLLMFGFKEK